MIILLLNPLSLLINVIKSSFPNIFFGFYDGGMTSEYAPGLLKYDVCMTEQVSGPQRTKIAGHHMVMIPYSLPYYREISKCKKEFKRGLCSY